MLQYKKLSWDKSVKAKRTKSNCSEVFLVKGVLKICSKFTGDPPMPKRDFNKVALQHYWNHTSTWVFFCKFDAQFWETIEFASRKHMTSKFTKSSFIFRYVQNFVQATALHKTFERFLLFQNFLSPRTETDLEPYEAEVMVAFGDFVLLAVKETRPYLLE